MTKTLIQTCGLLSLLFSAWNLFGDLYFLDFCYANMDGWMVRTEAGQGKLFDFSSHPQHWLLNLAQAGGWMYPIWAFATAVPLYVGLKNAGVWNSLVPCAVLAYGLCVVGGALHSAFAFMTALPNVYHHPPEIENWQGADEKFLETAQTAIFERWFVGFLPGYVACNVAAVWIAYAVQFKPTKFPKWFNLFNPFATILWVSFVGSMISDPWGFYLIGSLGTWSVMFLNLAVSYVLWNDTSSEEVFAFVNKYKIS